MRATAQVRILKGLSRSPDPIQAARELHAAIHQPDTALALFFCAPTYDREALGRELSSRFGQVPLIGCTTAGEITPRGYVDGSLVGVSFPRAHVRAATTLIRDLDEFSAHAAMDRAQELLDRVCCEDGDPHARDTFGLLLIDGLSLREEATISSLYGSLRGISIFGGSAGDGLAFGRSHVYFDGAFHTNSAVFAVIRTSLPFRVFKTQHFTATNQRLVVTGADVSRRIVTEINGDVAAETYAELVGCRRAQLTPEIFAAHPLIVRIGGGDYVRAIQKVNPDGSLTFYCAIDEGLVLSVGRGLDFVGKLQELFTGLREALGPPQLVIGCDCILRKLEMQRRGLTAEVERILAENEAIGFATYGEQFNAMHINQTFTGVAIGRGEAA